MSVYAAEAVTSLALTGEQVGAIVSVSKPTLALATLFFVVQIVMMSWDPILFMLIELQGGL